jgi:hypothetical protein
MSLDVVRLRATGEVVDADLARALDYPMLESGTPTGQVHDPTIEGPARQGSLSTTCPSTVGTGASSTTTTTGRTCSAPKAWPDTPTPRTRSTSPPPRTPTAELRAAEIRALNDDLEEL